MNNQSQGAGEPGIIAWAVNDLGFSAHKLFYALLAAGVGGVMALWYGAKVWEANQPSQRLDGATVMSVRSEGGAFSGRPYFLEVEGSPGTLIVDRRDWDHSIVPGASIDAVVRRSFPPVVANNYDVGFIRISE